MDELPRDFLERLAPLTAGLLALLVAGHVVALYFTARRFAVGGVFGPVNILTNPGWDPGIPLAVPIVGGTLALVVLVVTVGRACRTVVREPSPLDLPPSQDEAPPVPDPAPTAGVTYAGALGR